MAAFPTELWVTDPVFAGGAKGDGSTNDIAAFQAAVDAAPNSGAVIRAPAGRYRWDTGLVIPLAAAGVVKPIVIAGEAAGATDGAVGGTAQGGTAIDYRGSGIAIDASGGTRVDALNPLWSGGLRGLSLHNNGSGTIGIFTNSLLAAQFHNVTVRSFPKSWLIEGEYFYAMWLNCGSWRGQFDVGSTVSGSGPKANGGFFFNCTFTKFSGGGPALTFGDGPWPGQFIKLQHCYFEGTDGAAIYCQNASELILDQCYFETNCDGAPGLDDNKYIYFTGLAGDFTSQLVLDKCYARFASGTNDGDAFVEVLAPGGSARTTITIRDCNISAEQAAGMDVIRRNASSGGTPRIIASGNVTNKPSQTARLWSGSLGQIGQLTALNCMFTEDSGFGVGGTYIPAAGVI